MRTIALLLAAISTVAVAQHRPPRSKPPKFGSVYVSVMGEPFRADGDVDPFDRWFKQADQDEDGTISRLEMRKDAEYFFERLDVNGDKVIDGDEIERYEKVVAPAVIRGVGSDLGKYGRVPGKSAPRGASTRPGEIPVAIDGTGENATRIEGGAFHPPMVFTDVPQPVAMTDSNFDRRVTPTEFRQAANRRFARYDIDNDGKLTRKELKASKGSR